MARAVIFVNGSLPNLELVRPLIQPGDTLLAADGGTQHALDLGLTPSIIIGDMDSLNPDVRRSMERAGARLIQYSRDKDETDLELALEHALSSGHDRILLVGALGRRLDQTLGNLALLTAPRLAGIDIRLDDGVEEVFFTRSTCQVAGQPGEVVSLFPWGGEVGGIVTTGLRWQLNGEDLSPHRTRGISNELVANLAGISIKSGLLLVVHRRQKS